MQQAVSAFTRSAMATGTVTTIFQTIVPAVSADPAFSAQSGFPRHFFSLPAELRFLPLSLPRKLERPFLCPCMETDPHGSLFFGH